jgi:glycosyltransferase involved in cell wall biosynthesis
MKKRIVHIEQIEIISYEYPVIKIRVRCGKGTYIRSLARDVGDALRTGGFLSSLRRTRVGNFNIAETRKLKEFSMRIAIHASELDSERIDGTRVYISEVLNRLGDMAREDDFIIYHRDKFNKSLTPPKKDNYHIKALAHMPFWTQTRFAWDIWMERPDVLWVPLHDMPFIHTPKTKIIITVHDLAFKIFPETFPKNDVRKLNFLTDRAVKKADHIITVSKSTKRDLLKFYPQLKTDKITVVHLGMNINNWQREIRGDVVRKALTGNKIGENKYIISVGAIQPRKNLKVLIDAFVKIKDVYPDMKLVLVGGNGWMWQETHKYASKNKYVNDIIFTGGISFLEVQILMQRAAVFVFPSLYEGFGISGLEALAAGVPVVAAKNSSIPEVLGDAAIYFDANNFEECADSVLQIMKNKKLKQQLIDIGLKRSKKFSWDNCAKKTLRVLRQ